MLHRQTLFWLSLAFGTIPTARADFFLHSWENQHENDSKVRICFDGTFYQTSSNFDGIGASFTPTGLISYNRMLAELTASVGLSKRLSIYGRANWTYVNQNSSIRAATGYGFGDQSVGANFRIFENPTPAVNQIHLIPTRIDIQVQTDIPAYSTAQADTSGTAYLGDGTVDVTPGAFITIPVYPTHSHILNVVIGAGYTYRTNSFSAAIPWSFNLDYSPQTHGIRLSAAIIGLTSLRTDPNGTSTARSTTGSGGSFIAGGTNPSILQVRGRIGYLIDSTYQLTASVTQSLWGQASPNGIQAALGLQISLGNDKKSNPILMTPESYGYSNKGFLNYSLDAHILKSNDRLNLVKIDKGGQDGVEAGQIFDIFIVRKDGSAGEAVARAKVTSVKPDQSALEVTEYFKEVWIEEGFSAKRLIQ